MSVLLQSIFVTPCLYCLILGLGATSSLSQVLYSEGFDFENAPQVSAHQDEFTDLSVVNYSEFDVGTESHSIVEAPNRIENSAATQGILLEK